MAKVANKFWTEARNAPSVSSGARSAKVPFRGTVQHDTCIIDGVEVYRTTFIPKGHPSPASYAVDDAAQVNWKRVRSLPKDCPLRWHKEALHRWAFRWPLASHEICWGLGERYSGLNLRGKVHTLFTTDNDKHLESSDSLYKSIPLLFVLNGATAHGVFLDSPAPQVWDLDSERNQTASVRLLTRRGFCLYWLSPASVPKLVQAFTVLTGRHALPPRWSLGHQQSRWSYPTQSIVQKVAREYRRRKIPCDTLVLDIDYMDDYRVFTVSRKRFPQF